MGNTFEQQEYEKHMALASLGGYNDSNGDLYITNDRGELVKGEKWHSYRLDENGNKQETAQWVKWIIVQNPGGGSSAAGPGDPHSI